MLFWFHAQLNFDPLYSSSYSFQYKKCLPELAWCVRTSVINCKKELQLPTTIILLAVAFKGLKDLTRHMDKRNGIFYLALVGTSSSFFSKVLSLFIICYIQCSTTFWNSIPSGFRYCNEMQIAADKACIQ